jgi:hypothetical protein
MEMRCAMGWMEDAGRRMITATEGRAEEEAVNDAAGVEAWGQSGQCALKLL